MSVEQLVIVARGVIIRGESEILVIQRAEDSYAGGRWEVPGGIKVDAEEEDEARGREILEETGLKYRQANRVHSEVLEARGGHFPGKAFDIRTYAGTDGGGDVILSSEHQDYRWLPLAKAMDLVLTREARSVFDILNSRPLRYWLSGRDY